jgi:hypothetical protein
MKKFFAVTTLLPLFLFACATTPTIQQTQLQIREFQTRTYETNNVKMVMKAMMNVLQDMGFIIKSGDLDLGLLTATKETDVENKAGAVVLTILAGPDARWAKNSCIEATANISDFGDQCRVRVNFQFKSFDNKGNVMKLEQIHDEQYYQDFFAKVDKGIFIQKEKL